MSGDESTNKMNIHDGLKLTLTLRLRDLHSKTKTEMKIKIFKHRNLQAKNSHEISFSWQIYIWNCKIYSNDSE